MPYTQAILWLLCTYTPHTPKGLRTDGCPHVATRTLQRASFAMTIDIVGGYTPQASTYVDESGPLRTAICEAAGMAEGQAEGALEWVVANKPSLLPGLLQQHGSFSTQVCGLGDGQRG